MNHRQGHKLHMGLLAAALVAALVFGWSVGWAIGLGLLGCAAMLAAVFWIGRSSAQQTASEPSQDQRQPDNRPH